ncbi:MULTISPECIES: hypothetical protein [Enterobacteriaceae]|uniref:hypothetical protein n=1 Tax=Enterobacteriaceae TaxID=543 RepID=UPI001B8659A7|nr:hypothetical protein [Klebsiella grimontii]
MLTTEGDVIKLKVPYPNISSGLVRKSHMYIYAERKDIGKGLFVCTSKKPKHVRENVPPFNRFEISPDNTLPRMKSPFTMTTLVDCDRLFFLNGVSISVNLLTNPRCVCKEYLENILRIKEENKKCDTVILDASEMVSLNPLLNLKVSNSNIPLSS